MALTHAWQAHAPVDDVEVASRDNTLMRVSARTASTWGLADFLGALVLTLPVTPVAASLITVVASASASSAPPGSLDLRGHPMIVLPLNFLLSWLGLSLTCCLLGLARSERVNFSSFSDLRTRLSTLEVWCGPTLDVAVADCKGRIRDDLDRCRARAELRGHVVAIRTEMATKGPQWVLGVGYLSLWRRLHRAEALLPYLESTGSLRARADQLHLQIAGSTISGTATDRVDETLKALGNSDDPAEGEPDRRNGTTHPTGKLATKGWAARASLSQTQLSIDEFRDGRYAQLVSARNQLAATNAATGIALYALLWLAIVAQVNEPTVRAATAFYLVGALVGLFSVLYTQSGAQSAVDDYGLTLTRMLVTPQLSGIAAVLGVVITTMLSVAQFQSDPQVAATFHSQGLLADSFDLIRRPVNILTAAVFGFSPGLVLDRLRRQTDQAKDDLQRSRSETLGQT